MLVQRDSDHGLARAVVDATYDSLLWRGSSAFPDQRWLLRYITEQGRYRHRDFLDILLTVATIEGHPFNADALHCRLIDRRMVFRDRVWTLYINDEPNPVQLLLAWGRRGALDSLSPESARLACVTLTWLFTASNRRVRD